MAHRLVPIAAVPRLTLSDGLRSVTVSDLRPHEEAILAVVRGVFAPIEASGRGTIEIEHPNSSHGLVVRVRPSSLSASPITVHVESDDEVNLEIGRNGLATDLTGDPNEVLRVLRSRLDAIAKGSFRERVRFARDGTVGKGSGTFVLEGDHDEFTYYNIGPWLRSLGRRATDVS
jgi:hypothetical protein